MASTVKAGVESVFNKLSLDDSEPEVRAPSPEAVKELKEKFEEVDQGHVFAFFDDLTVVEKAALFKQLSNMNPKRISVRTAFLPFFCPEIHPSSISSRSLVTDSEFSM